MPSPFAHRADQLSLGLMPRPKIPDAVKAANLAKGLTPSGKIPARKRTRPRADTFQDKDYMRLHTEFTPERKKRYLAVLEKTGERVLARADVGVGKTTVYEHRANDEAFRDAEDEALRMHAAVYSTEMKRRAVEGYQEPVYGSKGPREGMSVIGWITKYSDRLLLELARRYEPEYTPKTKIESTSHVTQDSLGLEDLSPESREDLRRILEREAARKAAGDDPSE